MLWITNIKSLIYYTLLAIVRVDKCSAAKDKFVHTRGCTWHDGGHVVAVIYSTLFQVTIADA